MDLVTSQNKPQVLACKALDDLKSLRDQVRAQRSNLNQLVQLDKSFRFALEDSRNLEEHLVGQIVKLNQHIQQHFKSNCSKYQGKPENGITYVRAMDNSQTTGLKFQQKSLIDFSAPVLEPVKTTAQPLAEDEAPPALDFLQPSIVHNLLSQIGEDEVDRELPSWDDSPLPTFMPVSRKFPTTKMDCGCSYYGEFQLACCLGHADIDI